MWFNEQVAMYLYKFTLVSTAYIHFDIFINKDMPINFVNDKILLQHIKKLTSYKTDAFQCLYIATVHVHHTCSVANQV